MLKNEYAIERVFNNSYTAPRLGGAIRIYSGKRPDTPDSLPEGKELLAVIPLKQFKEGDHDKDKP